MKASELRDLAPDQLDDRLRELREELFNLRFQYATRQLTKHCPHPRGPQGHRRIATQQRQLELAEIGS